MAGEHRVRIVDQELLLGPAAQLAPHYQRHNYQVRQNNRVSHEQRRAKSRAAYQVMPNAKIDEQQRGENFGGHA